MREKSFPEGLWTLRLTPLGHFRTPLPPVTFQTSYALGLGLHLTLRTAEARSTPGPRAPAQLTTTTPGWPGHRYVAQFTWPYPNVTHAHLGHALLRRWGRDCNQHMSHRLPKIASGDRCGLQSWPRDLSYTAEPTHCQTTGLASYKRPATAHYSASVTNWLASIGLTFSWLQPYARLRLILLRQRTTPIEQLRKKCATRHV